MTNLVENQQVLANGGKGKDLSFGILNDIFGEKYDFRMPQLMSVGPREAKLLLEQNRRNRKVRKHHVKWLQKQMELGYWIYVGPVIGITKNGSLMDKQHTLMAVKESGKSFDFIVQGGFEDSAIEAVDVGIKRQAADVLAINGVKNAHVLAAICGRILNYRNEVKSDSAYGTGSKQGQTAKGDRKIINNTVILEWVHKEYDYLQVITKNAMSFYRMFKGEVTSFYGTFLYLFGEKDKEQAWEFMSKLCSGVGLKENSPILVLRRALEKDMISSKRRSRFERIYWIVKCWNKFRNGEEMKRVGNFKKKGGIPDII